MDKIPVDYGLLGARCLQLRVVGLLMQERQRRNAGVHLVGCPEACSDFEETNGSASMLMLLASHTVVSVPAASALAGVLRSVPHSSGFSDLCRLSA